MIDGTEKDKRTYSEKLTQLHGVILDAMELAAEMEKEDGTGYLPHIARCLHAARGAAIHERWRLNDAQDK